MAVSAEDLVRRWGAASVIAIAKVLMGIGSSSTIRAGKE